MRQDGSAGGGGEAGELLIDATDAPCPRCARPLGAPRAPGESVHPCPGCRGSFVDYATLAALVKREIELRAATPFAPSLAARPQRPAMSASAVSYVRCPVCGRTMNRTNFGQHSGVIVDVCKPHGTWFDAGELDGALEFVAYGGLEAPHEDWKKRVAEARAAGSAATSVAGVPARTRGDAGVDAAAEAAGDIITVLFDWMMS
jgi:Zn-finger nucleic acid-binding protein